MEIDAKSVYIGSGAFGLNYLLTNITIRSEVVFMGASVFSQNAPLTHVMLNKSATVISGLPSPLDKRYACDEAESKCGCNSLRIHSRSQIRILLALLVNLDLATDYHEPGTVHSVHLVDTLIIQHLLFVSNTVREVWLFTWRKQS